MHIHAICETGNRPQNEDFIISVSLSETSSIHIVADGMGGYEHGDIASKTVAHTIVDFFQQRIPLLGDVCNFVIRDAIELSNQTIQKLRSQYHSKMGATLAGLLILESEAFAFWVGDARIYLIRNNQIIFQSTDHSLINQIAQSGQVITQAIKQQYGHIVTRAIQGNPDVVMPEIVSLNHILPSDQFILCSDGVHNVISPSQLQQLQVMYPVPNDFMAEINKICSKDGTDNYSLISIIL